MLLIASSFCGVVIPRNNVPCCFHFGLNYIDCKQQYAKCIPDPQIRYKHTAAKTFMHAQTSHPSPLSITKSFWNIQ